MLNWLKRNWYAISLVAAFIALAACLGLLGYIFLMGVLAQ